MAIVTIGILAHVDAGKTSLTERILYQTGVVPALGSVDKGTTRTDTLELELGVEQREILRVRPGQPVRLRVDALPQRTFEGTVISVAELPLTGEDGVVLYPVRAAIPNPEALLKPEMAAHARVLTDPASTATRLLRGPFRWVRLTWWRLWS